jgi:beta-ureidopropionase / N-carbamoyl-L-amino-acid hydrolase
MRIHRERLLRDIAELGAIGRTPEGGVSRPSWSEADLEARRWLMARIESAGLTGRVDTAGNIFARWEPGSPVVLVGSHLDTVPNGGTLDGALGVLAGLECLRRIKEEGVRLQHPLELVAFTDEEGAFGGFFGSYAFTGALTPEVVSRSRDVRGRSITEAMARVGLDAAQALTARRDPAETRAYLELHIEQGPILEQRHVPIGIVETIVGILRFGVTFRGRADHAGTTPLADRKDALMGAADLIRRSRELIFADGTAASRVTVGVLQVKPGVPNIVPAEAYLTLELREVSREKLAKLAAKSRDLIHHIATDWGLSSSIENILDIDPVPLSADLQQAIQQAANELGHPTLRLPAMAGHDAQVVGTAAPAAMIFVPSREGRSHSPAEYTSEDDIECGANTLLSTLVRLCTAG